MLLQPGALIADRYRIERVLSTKPTGSLLAARARLDGSAVAIKIFPSTASSARLIKRFSRAQQIESPHVPKLLELGGIDETRTFIAMEFVEGEPLKALVASGPLPVANAVGAIRQACHAIATAHELGVVHRRLRTSKLFVSPTADGDHAVRVLGFMTSHSPSEARTDGLDYLAPEQLGSVAGGEAPADIWALGVILYELVTGRLPFASMTQNGVAKRIQSSDPKPPRALREEVPWQLEQLILRCLDRSPASRLGSVRELMALLEPFAMASNPASSGQPSTASTSSGVSARSVVSKSQIVPKQQVERLPAVSRTPTELPNVANLRNIISADETAAGQSAGFHRLGRDGRFEGVKVDEVVQLARRASERPKKSGTGRRQDELRHSEAPALSATATDTSGGQLVHTKRLVLALIVGAALLGVGGGLLVRLLSQ